MYHKNEKQAQWQAAMETAVIMMMNQRKSSLEKYIQKYHPGHQLKLTLEFKSEITTCKKKVPV